MYAAGGQIAWFGLSLNVDTQVVQFSAALDKILEEIALPLFMLFRGH